MKHCLFYFALLSFSTILAQKADSTFATLADAEIIWLYENAEGDVQKEVIVHCDTMTIQTGEQFEIGFYYTGFSCDQQIKLDVKAFEKTHKKARDEQTKEVETPLFFNQIPQKAMHTVAVGHRIYQVYELNLCNCYDPMCGAKHGHLQNCNNVFFTTEFGLLVQANESSTGFRGPRELRLLSVADAASDANQLVNYVIQEILFQFSPEAPILKAYLN